ncbi:MAG TPA: FecR family protein [bacterium]|nr:FecR family protein [bacterium]
MKKILILIIIFIGILALQLNADEFIKVKIINLEGDVIIEQSGLSKKAVVGDILKQGDKIKTGSKSICDLEFGDNTYTRIGELSNAEINEALLKDKRFLFLKKQDKQINLKLNKGIALTRLKKMDTGEEYKISTPTAVAGVRGTIFTTNVTNVGTNINVFQGMVSVTNLTNNTVTNVSAGQSVSISSEVSSGKSEVSAISTTELSAVKEAVGSAIIEAVSSVPVITPEIKSVIETITNTVQPGIIPIKPPSGASVIINFSN